MVDRFIQRVADLAGRTSRVLRKVADELEEEGYVTQPSLLKAVAKSNEALAHDCSTKTQPIEIGRYNLTERLKKIIDETDDIAADLLSGGEDGHNDPSEAGGIPSKAMNGLDAD